MVNASISWRQALIVLFVLGSIVHLAEGSACVPADTFTACQSSGHPVRSVCLASASCCGTSSGAVIQGGCTTRRYTADNNGTRTCLADGQRVRCSGGFVQSLCFGNNCSDSCASSNDIAAITCSAASVSLGVNYSSCTWRYGAEAVAGCTDNVEVLTGVCLSPANNFCGGESVGISCCTLTQNITFTQSLSRSVSHTSRTPTLKLTPSASDSPTESSSISKSTSPSHSSSTTLSPSITRELTSSPSITKSKSKTTTRSVDVSASVTLNISASLSFTPPTRTREPTVTFTASALPTYEVYGRSALIVADTQEKDTVVDLQALRLSFNAEMMPFLPIFLVGADTGPFGFNRRRNALLQDVELVSPTVARLYFKKDNCFEPKEGERVVFQPPKSMFSPPVSLSGESILEVETSTTSVRRYVGLVLVIVTALALLFALTKGQYAAIMWTVMSVQCTLLLTSHSCIRGRIEAYTLEVMWFVVPTFESVTFESYPHFGSVLIHWVIALLILGLHIQACRMSAKARMFFPNIPFFFASLLLLGICNSGWRSVLSDEPVGLRILSLILSMLFVGVVLAFSWTRCEPKGVVFLRYAPGHPRMYLSGTFYPEFLRVKYASLTDMWTRRRLRMTPITHAFYAASSFLTAMDVETTNSCYAVMGPLFALHLLHLLYVIYAWPGRGPIMQMLFVVPLVAKIFVLIGALSMLDCQGPYPSNVNFGEAMAVLGLATAMITALVLAGVSVWEAKCRKEILRIHSEALQKGDNDGAKVSDSEEENPPEEEEEDPADPDGEPKSPKSSKSKKKGKKGKRKELKQSAFQRARIDKPLPPLTHYETIETVREDPAGRPRVMSEVFRPRPSTMNVAQPQPPLQSTIPGQRRALSPESDALGQRVNTPSPFFRTSESRASPTTFQVYQQSSVVDAIPQLDLQLDSILGPTAQASPPPAAATPGLASRTSPTQPGIGASVSPPNASPISPWSPTARTDLL